MLLFPPFPLFLLFVDKFGRRGEGGRGEGEGRSSSRSTCPPRSPSPHVNSFVIGTAVINTHRARERRSKGKGEGGERGGRREGGREREREGRKEERREGGRNDGEAICCKMVSVDQK